MIVSHNNYKSNSSYSFKGLTSKLSKSVYTKTEVIELCKKYNKKSSSKVGKLPHEWISPIPFDDRADAVKQIYKTIGAAFSKLRRQRENHKLQNAAKNKIKKLFEQKGILKENDTVNVEFTGNGAYAGVYRLDVNDKSYAVKVFDSLLEASDSGLGDCNGNFFEQNVGQYIKKKIPKRNNNWFHMYFGDFQNGIMVSKFEDAKNPFTKKTFLEEKIGLLTSEKEHYALKNNIGGKIVDPGCIDILEHARNKTFAFVYSKSMKSSDAPLKILTETLTWKPSKIKNDRMKGVVYSFINLPEGNAEKCLNLLIPAADEEVLLYTIKNIEKIPFNLRKSVFTKLLEKNNERINIELARQLHFSGDKGLVSFDCFKKLKSGNNTRVNEILASQIAHLNKKQVNSVFNDFLASSNPKIRNELLKNLCLCSTERQPEFFKKLVEYGDANIVPTLMEKIFMYERKNLSKFAEILFETGSIEDKRLLAKNLFKFSHKNTYKMFEKLFALEDDIINEGLSRNISHLPEKYAKKWSILLMNY